MGSVERKMAEGAAEGAAKEAIWEPLMRDIAAEARQQPAVAMNESRCVCVRVCISVLNDDKYTHITRVTFV